MIRQRKPIKRYTAPRRGLPPKRKTPVARQRRRGPRRVLTVVRNEAYKAAVRQLPCVGLPGGVHAFDCWRTAPSDASHVGRDGGQGLKASDDTCVPHSRPCHNAWGAKRWTQEERRAFADLVVPATRAQVAGLGVTVGEGVPW